MITRSKEKIQRGKKGRFINHEGGGRRRKRGEALIHVLSKEHPDRRAPFDLRY